MPNSLYKIILFVLVLLLLVLFIQNLLLKKSNNNLIKDSGKLPDGVKQEIVVKKDKVTIKEKIKDSTGTTEIKTDIKYIPPEGDLTISIMDDGTTQYVLNNKGFTFTPGIIVIPSNKTDVGVNIRLVYWNRFGAGMGGVISIEDSPKAGLVGVIDYRVYNNFAIGIAYKEGIDNRRFGASVAYYF